MIDRRQYKRVSVDFWVSLTHPLLGVITGNVRDMSIGGMAVQLDENVGFFCMMELDARLHGNGWDDSLPSFPVQVVRVNAQEIGLRFLKADSGEYVLPYLKDEKDFDFTDQYRQSVAAQWMGQQR